MHLLSRGLFANIAKVMANELKNVTLLLNVQGEDPRVASAPIFSNFLGISHVGSEVQFEFIFLDINLVAQAVEERKQMSLQEARAAEQKPPTVSGKTVAKIVMPIASFVQLKGHVLSLFEKFEKVLERQSKKEHPDERTGSDS